MRKYLFKHKNWICDCDPPLPNLMIYGESLCEVCGMARKDIKERLESMQKKARENREKVLVKEKKKKWKYKVTPRKHISVFCPKCNEKCSNKQHQKVLYVDKYGYYDIENGKVIKKLSESGLKRLI